MAPYEVGRNLPYGRRDKSYGGLITIAEGIAIGFFYREVISAFVTEAIMSLSHEEIAVELRELVRIDKDRLRELEPGDEVSFRVGDVRYFIRRIPEDIDASLAKQNQY